MATLKDLSQHLGLSVTQVSRALNDHDDVSAETKARVREAAKTLNYQPNVMARRLKTGRSGSVGLIWQGVPEPSESWIFTQFVSGLSAEFNRLGLQFMLNMADNETAALDVYDRLITSRSIDGFVVILPQAKDPRVDYLRRRKVPFVLHGQTMDDPDYAYYDIDNYAVAYDLTTHLARRGHRDIAFINGQLDASFVQRRYEGHIQALRENGIVQHPEFHVGGRMTQELGLLETIRLFQSAGPKPTAIIASHMLIAKGVTKAAQLLGLRIPQDLSLVVHDDCIPLVGAEDFPVALTSTVAPLHEAWGELAASLDSVIKGGSPKKAQKVSRHRFRQGQSVAGI
ncbi:LacI family DNA-binding transcriptional regulator [Cribrihabitans neustonicus]|uniref:LacI family DNA-binding transcriptional regulator n=1 Tax=Cribrihabitans neustonicus TaxID=1429085 RepID=UPI003B58E362